MSKYDKIGQGYNQTRTADRGIVDRIIHHLQARQTGLYLDIGCGTGNYTSALQNEGYSFIGIDPSSLMIDKARSVNSSVDWRIGEAGDTGLVDNEVTGIVATLTIHHLPSLHKGFKELARVLKTSGRMVIFTSTPTQMEGYWLNHYFPKMMQDSISQMPSVEVIRKALSASGLSIEKTEKFFVPEDLKDRFLYCGKHASELYFDEDIRRGISSFSSLSNRVEVVEGLEKLAVDLKNHNFQEIKKRYENSKGDYLFVVIEKNTDRQKHPTGRTNVGF